MKRLINMPDYVGFYDSGDLNDVEDSVMNWNWSTVRWTGEIDNSLKS